MILVDSQYPTCCIQHIISFHFSCTSYKHYTLQLRARGQAPKALRWKRLESRYKAHQQCVNNLTDILRRNNLPFSCVNRVELDRQHLSDIDLVIAVGGDGTVLSSAHFLDHGTSEFIKF